jgi:hypothetical protein
MIDLRMCFTHDPTTDGLGHACCRAGSAALRNVIDLGVGGLHIGHAKKWLIIKVMTADFNTLTSLKFTLRCHEDASMGGGVETKMTGETILLAQLTNGAVICNRALPAGVYEQYLDIYVTVGGANPTTGEILAYIANEPDPDNEVIA